ncbi:MAG: archaetidylinositol phosphate synthase [Sulfolobaceae archaeon]|jgi:archaetidylinositol phosphate synthase|nr:archaetidylinositol phosphate synthase [Sulfolobaceae archaeon]
MITKIRKQSKRILQPIARLFVSARINANTITFIGLAFSFLYLLIIYEFKNVILGILFIALSAFMDALDGEVARLSNSASQKGSFIDSSLDRIEDINYFLGLALIGFQTFIIAIIIGVSLLIPYLRAKGESLGLKVEGRGIIERGERIIFVVIILVLSLFSTLIASYVLYALLVLSIITVIQRFYYIYVNLP